MLIQQKKTGSHEMFYVEEDGKILAEMVFTIRPDHKMVIEHTQVDESLQGKNVGYQLVDHGVEYARANNLKIIPLCSFAKAMFNKHPDLGDCLA